ncbi:MAG: response regulator [Actinomycetota bacterium]
MRQTGLPVEADIEPVPGSLPPGVDLTAYRVIQEALTNALKHGGGARARLLLRFDAEALDVQVSDDGRGPPPDGTRIQGHGLIGMRERVALFGGTLETGERPGRGLRGEGPDPAGGTDVTIRVLIADDQALMRGGFRMILEAEEDIEVVGEAIDGRDALEQFGRFDPDVVVMDIRMPAMDGIEATRRLTEGDSPARVLILTTFDLDEYVYGALRAGASGFLLKDRPPEELVAAVRVVASGEALLAPSVTRRLIEEFAKRPGASTPPEGLDELTDREREVLVLMAQGLSNSEIAGRLFVAETTVKTHVGHVLQKLQLRDRAQAVVVAYESGLVQPSP